MAPAPAAPEPAQATAKPEDVRFLALEGGGGKGVTYLGAIRALEQLRVLPIDTTTPGANRILGISGASAGAITALLLGMGLTSVQLAKILSNPATFTGFFDGPDPGLVRVVGADNKPGVHRNPTGEDERTFVKGGISARFLGASAVGAVVESSLRDLPDPIVAQLLKEPALYLYNLLFDRGLFPGFAPRRFLAAVIDAGLNPALSPNRPGRRRTRQSPGAVIGFEEFYSVTGVDLVITGANVTQRRPAMFSRRFTPDFPVAEAVGISMNLPVLFKPVRVEANVAVGEHHRHASDYHGNWVDGGLLNNLPLHAFDHVGQAPGTPSFSLPLNPAVLGLRLTEGPLAPNSPSGSAGFATIKQHLGDVFETLLYASEQGQIRTPEEARQTIDLLTYGLSTTNFAQPASDSEKPVREAESAVYQHFGGRFRSESTPSR